MWELADGVALVGIDDHLGVDAAGHEDTMERASHRDRDADVVERMLDEGRGPDPRGERQRALVAVSVTTTNRGAADEQPRYWRMRLTVTKQGEDAKVSKVEFVP